MNKLTTKAYMTKYALTQGITQVLGYSHPVPLALDTDYGLLFSGEYSLTLEKAREVAEEMRQKKITSLKRQILKLESMKFFEETYTDKDGAQYVFKKEKDKPCEGCHLVGKESCYDSTDNSFDCSGKILILKE